MAISTRLMIRRIAGKVTGSWSVDVVRFARLDDLFTSNQIAISFFGGDGNFVSHTRVQRIETQEQFSMSASAHANTIDTYTEESANINGVGKLCTRPGSGRCYKITMLRYIPARNKEPGFFLKVCKHLYVLSVIDSVDQRIRAISDILKRRWRKGQHAGLWKGCVLEEDVAAEVERWRGGEGGAGTGGQTHKQNLDLS